MSSREKSLMASEEHLKMPKKIATLAILTMILVLDLAYKMVGKTASPVLGFPELLVIVLIMFVGAGERIKNLYVGKEGVKIEQNVDDMVKDAARIASISKESKPELVEQLLNRTTKQSRDVWSQMIIYRLTIRALLRQLCTAHGHGMELGDTTSLEEMLECLRGEGDIPEDLYRQVDSIRKATFFFEWGTGRAPGAGKIKDVLSKAPEVIRQLNELGQRSVKPV